MLTTYRFFVNTKTLRWYAATAVVSQSFADGRYHAGISYQGKKDKYDHRYGKYLAEKRLDEDPLQIDTNHYDPVSQIIWENAPSHIRKCSAMLTSKAELMDWLMVLRLAKVMYFQTARNALLAHNKMAHIERHSRVY